jgi:hypothetical protein
MKHLILGILAGSALATQLSAQSVNTVVATNLAEPFGVVADGTGSIFITDAANNRIVKFNVTTGQQTTLAGSLASGSVDATGSLAKFYYPQGIIAARGGLVVADSGNNTIRFVTFNGVVTTIAGQSGAYDFQNGNGTGAHFANPLGLAVDSSGNIFVADMGNNAIRKIAPDNTVTTVINSGLSHPTAVSVGDNGDLWVADTQHHVIKRFDSSGNLLLTAGLSGTSGTDDSQFASTARFNAPQGILWLGNTVGLLISDTGNHSVRRLYFNSDVNDYSVETLAGTPGHTGFVNGLPLESKFNFPIGLSRDPINGGFLVVDRANNAVRRLQTTAPQPPVSAPQIGTVSFPPPDRLSVLTPVTSAVFNNDVIIAVLPESGTETFFTFGPTPASSFEDTIPLPSSTTGNTPPPYQNGLLQSEVNGTLIAPQPDVTVKVIGTQDGRQSSPIVEARFQFKTANPSVDGDNAASFTLNDVTVGSEIWYTIDGSDPTNDVIANPAVVGPIVSGTKLSIQITTNTVFKARAYRTNYKPSEVFTKEFSPESFVANRISFGFESGEASSEFVASAGQKFYAPVTLSILPNQQMYSLQFNLTVTNEGSAPAVTPGDVSFQSMLKEFLPEVKLYRTIPPAMVIGYSTNFIGDMPDFSTNYQSLLFTNTTGNNNLLGVGWLARSDLDPSVPNLFNVSLQDLISYSIVKDTLFTKANKKIVTGGYSFGVPLSAVDGDQYQIQVGRPSATTDGFGAPGSDIFIQAPTNGTFFGGSINSIKLVTVGQRKYIVGDVYPFKWLNAGDFGDTNLFSADVAQVFQTAVYHLNAPIPGSDLEDAMDSCCGTGTPQGDYLIPGPQGDPSALFDGDDTVINTFAFGDGNLDIRDIFVTFRRSLDSSLTWYERYFTNGVRVAKPTANVYNGARPANNKTPAARPSGSSVSPLVNFSVGDISGAPGQTISVPVKAQIFGDYPLRVLDFNVTIEAVDGSPAITNAIQFSPGSLGAPALVFSSGPNNYAAAWLNNAIAGLSGSAVIGNLQITIPSTATTNSAYRAHFDHVSASPNGLARFNQNVQDGLVLLSSRTNSSWNDTIPDSWRIRYFGSLANALSQANADADGDGVSNLAEYKAGTNPNDVSSFLHLTKPTKDAGLTVQWPSVAGKTYVVESASALFGAEWTAISTNIIGDGSQMQFTDSTANGIRFYRVRVVEP